MARFLAAFVAAISLAAALAAQAPAPPQRQPRFKVAANFVRVDVYPTADGRIVPDLRQDEFEVREDGVPQKIETFEHIVIRAPGPEAERIEPADVERSREEAANPRNRLFVLFLDSYHTTLDATKWEVGSSGRTRGGHVESGAANSRIGRALATFLDRLIGPDDLIALTRPEMPVHSLVFTRRPSSLEQMLLDGGEWQRRPVAADLPSTGDLDVTEQAYVDCYQATPNVAAQMIARRRERMVLSALQNLVHHLQGLREERKAILVVTEGWTLFRPDSGLTTTMSKRLAGRGAARQLGEDESGSPSRAACDRDRGVLAQIDDQQEFRDLLDEANRANASFYPIDPRGLAAFDSPIPSKGQLPSADLALLHGHLESLQTLAVATDGVAIVNSNDFAKNFARIAADLSSYYLLGYYSTNTKTDGKFRKVAVRVNRPGVAVRARRGYLAMTEEEAKAAEAANAPPPDADTVAFNGALETLDHRREDQAILLRGAYDWSPTGAAGTAALSVVAELDAAAARQPGWADGAQLTATLVDLDGRKLSSAGGALSRDTRARLIRFPDSQPPGDYLARVVVKWSVLMTTEQVRIKVPDAPGMLAAPIVFRRGPYTGARFQPTADLRFRRAERIRVEAGVQSGADAVGARLLDRKGMPLAIPVTAEQRDAGGSRVASAELSLAPLALADYVIELSVSRGGKTERSLTAFRLVP